MLLSKIMNSRGIFWSLLAALVLLNPWGASAQPQGFLEINSLPFGVGPGRTVDIMTMNPCPNNGGVELLVLGLSGAEGDDVWFTDQRVLEPDEAYVVREVVPDGVIERSIAQVRMRFRCQGNLSRNAVQGAREAARFSVEIVDDLGMTVRTQSWSSGDFNADG
jgi:hypothetical protein